MKTSGVTMNADERIRGVRKRPLALFGVVLATAALATGCGTVSGSNNTGSAVISTEGECPQLHAALTNLAALPFSQWNKPLSELSIGPSVEQLGEPATTKASDSYASLVGGTEWAKC
jgi:hypothetical protein